MYKISRFTSYIDKKDVYAVYCNFNLYFFKNETFKMFKKIINNDTKDIDNEFIKFLLDKEIITEDGDKNV